MKTILTILTTLILIPAVLWTRIDFQIEKVDVETYPWFHRTRNYDIKSFDKLTDIYYFSINDQDQLKSVEKFLTKMKKSEDDIYNIRYKCKIRSTANEISILYIGRNGIIQYRDMNYNGGMKFIDLLLKNEPDTIKRQYSEKFYEDFGKE